VPFNSVSEFKQETKIINSEHVVKLEKGINSSIITIIINVMTAFQNFMPYSAENSENHSTNVIHVKKNALGETSET
jgi:hypothetical protein